MVDYKAILRLNSEKLSLRQIAARVGNSHHTVKNVIDTAAKNGVAWPIEEDVTNQELEKLLFPDRMVSKNVMYAEPDYSYIHKELSKKGVTLTLLWNEYCERCRTNGEIPYMSTQFCDKYRRWAKGPKLQCVLIISLVKQCKLTGQAVQFHIMIQSQVKNSRHISSLLFFHAVELSMWKHATI